MYDDIFNLASQYMGRFSDTVRDRFGQSIISDVFEPMLQDISSLRQMEEFFRARAAEIDRLSEELRYIGGTA